MISANQLESIGFYTKEGTEYFDETFSFMFNIKSQELFTHDESNGDLDFLCKVTDFESFDILLSTFNY